MKFMPIAPQPFGVILPIVLGYKKMNAETENQKYTKPCPYNPEIKCVQYPEKSCGCNPCKECENYKHKPCPHCGTDRPSDFYDKCPTCKKCLSKQSKQKRYEQRQRHLEWRKKWMKKQETN